VAVVVPLATVAAAGAQAAALAAVSANWAVATGAMLILTARVIRVTAGSANES